MAYVRGAGKGLLEWVGFEIKVRAGLPDGVPVGMWLMLGRGRLAVLGGG